MAPLVNWSGSSNAEPIAVLWPPPTRLVIEGLRNNVYTDDVVLPVTFAASDPRAPATLQASIDYAACAEICVPFHADVRLTLPPGPATVSREAGLIGLARASVPGSPATVGIDLRGSAVTGAAAAPTLTVDLASAGAPFVHPDLFVEGAGESEAGEPSVALSEGGHRATLQVRLPEPMPPHAALTLTLVDGDRRAEFALPAGEPAGFGWSAFAAILLTALGGGLILNLMPCVLPVLSIKMMSIVRHAGEGRGATRAGLVATALGVIASFLVIGLSLVALKLSGATVGWGIQFQQPWFLGGMATLTVLFAASLFEWLPIRLPGALAERRTGGRRGPLTEAFLTGALATLLATPCSAPLVGTAVGFALAQGPREILSVFLFLGLGMAMPYLLAALRPGLLRWLPRPGSWMVRLRQGLGLLLLGTTAWLLFVLGTATSTAAAAVMGAVLVALLAQLAWTSRSDPFRTRPASGLATAGLAIAALGTALLAPATVATSRTPDGWRGFDPTAVQKLLAEGKTVVVDVTASWCLTCKVNELTTFERPAVLERLGQADIVRMRADWSRPDPAIAAFLQQYGRYGIPLDVVFTPARPAGQVLPELLTPAILLAALG